MMLAGIVHDADRMDQTLRLLVDAARLATGNLDLFREQTYIRDLVEQIAAMQARDPEHPGVVFAGEPGPFFVDPARLRTTVLAFCEALTWWGADGDITITTDRQGDVLHLTAARGSGSDLDDAGVAALFQARSPGTGGGSKIGLYVARGLAQAQGGRAWGEVAEATLTLHLELPLGI